jgi:3-deoxy-D-manno-octulosonic-acid transferase
MWRGERQAVRILREQVDPTAQYVWFHAASLGEFEQGRPLMEQLRREHPEYKILLTFFSPSGYEVRKNYEGADIICYLPLDTITNARRFLRVVRPVMAFFIKYEFWYNYLHILKHRQVPVYSVSSIFRPGQIFFRWYGRQYAHVLKCFTKFYVQNEVSRQLLSTIGITNVDVVGDTRFDRVLQIKEAAKQLPVVEQFCQRKKVFIAGSSWQPDEEIFIPYFNEHKDWKLIIAPHVIGDDHLLQIEKLLQGRRVLRYTQAETCSLSLDAYDVLIIDCFGLLSSIYHYADVTYVGGGFGVGIHNLLEAAVWDVPVIFGPNNQRFREAQGLKACGGGLEIHDAESFRAVMDQLMADEQSLRFAGQKAGAFVQQMTGATHKILHDVGRSIKR